MPLPHVETSIPTTLYGRSLIRPSGRHPRYFETTEGQTFIPIGMNLCFPRHTLDREKGLGLMFRWLDRLSANGGNFTRIFMGHPFFDIECGHFGDFDEEKASRLTEVLDYAWGRGVRLKLTIELFRAIQKSPPAEIFPGAVTFTKSLLHVANGGPFADMDDYLTSERGRTHFLRKLDWLAERYARHPGILGWDLWNEMNAVFSGHWLQWTREMLPELKSRFPHHLATQTLGSMDGDDAVQPYNDTIALPGNEISQVHRYLDAGARWDICHGPVDIMAADAVRELLHIAPNKPAMLAEGGAVLPHHMGPWDLYPADKDGIILHDVLFAPFFSGAAGSGQAWHWQEYVDPNDLWWHFARFARAIEGIDPVAEDFMPARWDTERLRVYVLQGANVRLAWCRDAASNWQTELVEKREPELIRDSAVTVPVKLAPDHRVSFYDPWSGQATEGLPTSRETVSLPPFRRSLVIRF